MSYTVFLVGLILSGALTLLSFIIVCVDHRHKSFGLYITIFILALIWFSGSLYAYLTPKIYSDSRTVTAAYSLCPMDEYGGLYVVQKNNTVTFRYQSSSNETKLGSVDAKYADIQFQIDGEPPKVWVVHETDNYLYDLLGLKIKSPKRRQVERLYFRSPADKTDIS